MRMPSLRKSVTNLHIREVVFCATLLALLNAPDYSYAQRGVQDAWPSVSEIVAMGNRAQAEGNFTTAIFYYNRALELEARSAVTYLDRGRAEQGLGHFDEAYRDYTAALSINPHLAAAHNNCGIIMLQRGDYAAAVAETNKALKADKHLAESYVIRGTAYYLLGNLKSALVDLTQGIRLLPRYFVNSIQLSMKNPVLAVAYNSRGLVRHASGDVAGAIADFDQSLKIDNDVKAYINRGNARATKGDFAGAISDYTTALALAPGNITPQYGRGKARLLVGDPDGAIEDFTAALQQVGKQVEEATIRRVNGSEVSDTEIRYGCLNNRGVAWMRKGEHTRARMDFTEAIALCPHEAPGYANRGRLLLERGELESAVDDLNKAIEIDPGLAKPYMDRGLVRLEQGSPADADRDFQKCLALDPTLKSLLETQSRQISAAGLPTSRDK